MIVPRTRLLLWTSFVIPPFALLQAVEPASTPVALMFISGLVLLAIIDAVSARRCLAGIEVALPTVSRMSKDRESKVEVRIRNPRLRPRVLRVALPLPAEITTPDGIMDIALPSETEWSRMDWTCTGTRRGSYRINASRLECSSPLGFWAVRKTAPLDSEIRVYPNLLNERRNLAALFLNRGLFGLHSQRQVGQGREFEKLRDYSPGDSFDGIHWKATARRGKPVTKVFQVERTQEVYVVIDTSRLSGRSAGKPRASSAATTVSVESLNPALERFVTAALVLGLAAEKQGDLFGLVTFSDQIGTFLRARNGASHYHACRDALYTLEPSTASPDFDELFTFLRLRLRRRALLFVLTALDDPALAEGFVEKIDIVSRQHVVLVNMLQPPGAFPLFSDPDVQSQDDLYRHLGGHLQWRRLRELDKVLGRRGVQFSLLSEEKLGVELVRQYLSVKQRQLL